MLRKRYVVSALALGAILIVGAVCIDVARTTSSRVVVSAKEIAGSQPYCIQVAGKHSGDYRPARSWLDLSIFMMRAERFGSIYLQHHAVLVVGSAELPRLYHWTYRGSGFKNGVLNGGAVDQGPAVTCLPVQNFAETQLPLHPEPLTSNYVRYAPEVAYRIPVEWQARWSGGMSRTLLWATTAPDFKPLDRKWSDLSPGERDSNSVSIEWETQWVLNLIKNGPRGVVSEQSKEFGLSRTTTVTQGKDGKEYIGLRYVSIAEKPNLSGDNTTVIDCSEPSNANPKACQHRFINRGRHFYFRHAPGEISNWQNMQRRILGLMGSFEVSSKAS